VNDLFAVLDHPQLVARQRWADVDTPNGTFQALRPPVDVEGIDIEMGRVPRLGEHTAAVLDWLRETDPR
jgi:crotonobetainyl-CoA:carnitine CoA-transferase CaiB-like acyl-CoA transferase